MFDNVICTLLNVPGKSKDGINARLDMEKMGMRNELRPVKKGDRTFLPPAAHTQEKRKLFFVIFFMELKFQRGSPQTLRDWFV